MRRLFAVVAMMLACAILPAWAQETAVQSAGIAYREGRVQDALAGLERAITPRRCARRLVPFAGPGPNLHRHA